MNKNPLISSRTSNVQPCKVCVCACVSVHVCKLAGILTNKMFLQLLQKGQILHLHPLWTMQPHKATETVNTHTFQTVKSVQDWLQIFIRIWVDHKVTRKGLSSCSLAVTRKSKWIELGASRCIKVETDSTYHMLITWWLICIYTAPLAASLSSQGFFVLLQKISKMLEVCFHFTTPINNPSLDLILVIAFHGHICTVWLYGQIPYSSCATTVSVNYDD